MSHQDLRLLVVGVTHKTAPVEIRERLALSAENQARLGERLRESGASEFLVLNTCNRVEVYAATLGNGDASAIASQLAAVHGISEADISSALLSQFDSEAVQHLFEVASGVDSQMVGETEILGQVKEAYDHALKTGTV